MLKYILMIALMLSCADAKDEKEINVLPFDYMNVQYAGYIGYVSIGGGNTFYDGHYDFEVFVGITPRLFDVSEISVYTLAIKNNYVPYTFTYGDYDIRPYIGVGILASKSQRYDPNWSDSIDDGYYYQNNWHVTSDFGININKKLDDSSIKSVGMYAEAVALDVFIQNYFKNSGTLKINEVYTWSVGARIGF